MAGARGKVRIGMRSAVRVVGLVLVLGVGALQVGTARATTVLPAGLDDLCRHAAVIVRGRVVRTEAAEVPNPTGRPLIKTAVTFAVERVLKGQAPEALTVKVPGGRVGDRELRVSGVPSLAMGDRVLVFLAPEGSAFVPFVGVDQGVFRIEHDPTTGSDVVAPADVRRLERAEVRRAGGQGARRAFAAGSAGVTLERFEEQVDAIVE